MDVHIQSRAHSSYILIFNNIFAYGNVYPRAIHFSSINRNIKFTLLSFPQVWLKSPRNLAFFGKFNAVTLLVDTVFHLTLAVNFGRALHWQREFEGHEELKSRIHF